MKGKLLLGILVLAAAAFFGYQYMLGQNTGEDEANVRNSFRMLTTAIAKNDAKTINAMVSPKFSDSTLKKRTDFVKVLMIPRKIYTATVSNVQMQGTDMALVFYNRTEVRGQKGKMIRDNISGEIWSRDPANPKEWKLTKLAQKDKWFRSTEIPIDVQATEAEEGDATAKEKPVLGTLEEKEAKAKAEVEEFAALEAEAKAKKDPETGEAETEGSTPEESEGDIMLASYNPAGKRDPFLPWGERGIETPGGQCEPERPKEYLESHELLSLKLEGVIHTETDALALVTTPDGKGYTLRRNMYLGKNCGLIIDIEEERIVIREMKKDPTDPFSDWQKIESELKLRPEEGT